MTIKVGDRLPAAQFAVMTADGPTQRATDEIFKGKTIVLFGVPGAFTPFCDKNHLRGYLDHAQEIKAKGVDAIAVVSVNDVFVMGAWEKDSKADGRVLFLADGGAQFARALGLDVDLTTRGMGIRSQRYSMLVKDGVVEKLNVEEKGGANDLSSAKTMLEQL